MKTSSTQEINPVREYWQQIQGGLVVSKKIRAVYKKLVQDMDNPECIWEYNERRANHAILFIETYCRHSKGKQGGKPLILELWQKAAIAAIFGFIHKIDKVRRFLEVILDVARKNGKSTLAAAIGIYLMIADGEAGAEIYAVATKRDQAKIIWLEAKRMIKKSPELRTMIKCLVGEIVSDFNDSSFKPLGSDSETLDGLNVHGGLFDEIHAWKDRNLYDVVKDGTTSREQPLIFVTTTAGTVRDGIYDIKYEEAERVIAGYESGEEINERMLPLFYELDSRDEWTDPKCWPKANPGLGTIKNTNQLEAKVKAAKLNFLLVKNLLCKDFNIRETSTDAFLNYEQLNNEAKFAMESLFPKPCYAFGGVDLSETTDLTASVVLFKTAIDSPVYILSQFWLPEDLLEKRAKEDKIPYDIWVKAGLMRTTPGNKLHPKFITQWMEEVQTQYNLCFLNIGYDAWGAKYWLEEMSQTFGPATMEQVIQGKKTLSQPMKTLKADLEAKKIIYNNHPILKWNMANVNVDIDKNGNIQPIKGRNQRLRIDGFAALLNAYVVYQNHMEEYNTCL